MEERPRKRARREAVVEVSSRLIHQIDDDHDQLELLVRAIQALRSRVFALETRCVELERRADEAEYGPNSALLIKRKIDREL